MTPPLIGITCDNVPPDGYTCAAAYSQAVAAAGGVPVLLPQQVDLVDHYLARCAGLLLTGGTDPDVRPFGQALHPQARLMHPRRQAFDTALLQRARPTQPVLGVCLGMQLMGLLHGATLNQHLPDTLPSAAEHIDDRRHTLNLRAVDSVLGTGDDDGDAPAPVVSWHRQALADPGRLRLLATAPDGVVEAIDDPNRPFFLGVQWHPERGGAGAFNQTLIARFVQAAGRFAAAL